MVDQLQNVVNHDSGLAQVGKGRSCSRLTGRLSQFLASSVDDPEDSVGQCSSLYPSEARQFVTRDIWGSVQFAQVELSRGPVHDPLVHPVLSLHQI